MPDFNALGDNKGYLEKRASQFPETNRLTVLSHDQYNPQKYAAVFHLHCEGSALCWEPLLQSRLTAWLYVTHHTHTHQHRRYRSGYGVRIQIHGGGGRERPTTLRNTIHERKPYRRGWYTCVAPPAPLRCRGSCETSICPGSNSIQT